MVETLQGEEKGERAEGGRGDTDGASEAHEEESDGTLCTDASEEEEDETYAATLRAADLRAHPREAAAMLIPEIELHIGHIEKVLWTASHSDQGAGFLIEARTFFAPIREHMVEDLINAAEFLARHEGHTSVPPLWKQRVETFVGLFRRLEEVLSAWHCTEDGAEHEFS
eukprot:8532765-Alexandrium_andersonii.AAC.1